MENKVRFDGVIQNDPKVSQYNTMLLRLQNKQEFTQKDGKPGSKSCTACVSLRDKIAAQVMQRFKRGDIVRVEGRLVARESKTKETKEVRVCQEGNPVWEIWIEAYKVDAIMNITEGKPIAERTGYPSKSVPASSYSAEDTKDRPQKKTFGFKQSTLEPEPVQTDDPNQVFEEIFSDTLPF